MSLFHSQDSDERRRARERTRRQKERARREKEYQKQHKKVEQDRKDDQKSTSLAGKTVNFLGGLVDLFMPAKSRITHNRLIQSGAAFGICLILLIVGFGITRGAHIHKEIIRARTQTFTSTTLQFSKTQTEVSTHVRPFITQDRKTVYVPFYIKDTSQVDIDASKYHILMMPINGKELTYHPTIVQLYSYGSSGRMFLVVHSADPIQNQTVQFLLWSGTTLTNDHYDSSEDNSDTTPDTLALKQKYDTLGFTINLGGSSIDVISKTMAKKVQERVTENVPQKHGKPKKVTKIKTVVKQVPNPTGQYLYGDRKLQYIYNRIYAGKRLEKVQKNVKKNYDSININVAKVKRDWNALKTAGYKMPKLPDWGLGPANNLKNGLPLTYDQIEKLNLLNDPFITPSDSLKKVDLAYKKDNSVDSDDDANASDNSGDDDSSSTSTDTLSSIQGLPEGKYLTNLGNLTLKNKATGQIITGSSDTDDSSDHSRTAPDKSSVEEWQDLQESLANIVVAKNKIYNKDVLTMYGYYQDFLRYTSSGSESAKVANTGAITMSKTSGYNKHGKYMTIFGIPTDDDKKK